MISVDFDTLYSNIDQKLQIIEKDNPYNAFLSTLPESVKELKSRVKQEDYEKSRLAGVTLGIKDNIHIKGHSVSCASKILEDYTAPYNATVIDKIKDAGGIMVGKTNMDEFAMGSSTEYSAFGNVLNPSNTEKVPGGSSGGSAAAVAGDLVDVALGSDTGGSIRQPAAFCGIVGIKPTYGRVSRYGLVAFASSLDQIGPFGRSVEDAARLLEVIAGYDKNDSTSVDIEVPEYTNYVDKDIRGKTIGIPTEYFDQGLNKDINNRIQDVIKFLEKSGAEIRSISLPHTSYAVAAYYIIATAEASSNLARYDGIRYGLSEREAGLQEVYRDTRHAGFGQEVKRRILLGTYVLSSGYYEAYYDKAQRIRRLIKEDFTEAFEEVDVIFTPTTPTTAFDIGGKVEDPLAMYLSDVYTVPINLAGVPAISIPLGNDADGLPIGGQIIAPDFQEQDLIQVGDFLEKNYIQ
ncbi:MAG: Asp-tRNA(Asn)/Glu-tRNA(Gln) amidotransferase subunit GatA [Candidatus Marinimicrobia bacterium]|nr:Asp-tRNA(Asn)/Glu-tRNA(Gln) amidotransferase subunit GatA [Candidatus Neomarinimicrobiota bacterium]